MATTNTAGQTHLRNTKGMMDILLAGASDLIEVVSQTRIGVQDLQIEQGMGPVIPGVIGLHHPNPGYP